MILLNVYVVVSMPLLAFSVTTFCKKHVSLGPALLQKLLAILDILNVFSEILFV